MKDDHTHACTHTGLHTHRPAHTPAHIMCMHLKCGMSFLKLSKWSGCRFATKLFSRIMEVKTFVSFCFRHKMMHTDTLIQTPLQNHQKFRKLLSPRALCREHQDSRLSISQDQNQWKLVTLIAPYIKSLTSEKSLKSINLSHLNIIDKENGILYNLIKLGRKKIPGLFLPLYCNVTILHSPTHMRKNMWILV